LIANTSSQAASSSSSQQQQQQSDKKRIVDDAVNALFDRKDSPFARDTQLELPRFIQDSSKVPTVTVKANSHRGNEFWVWEGKPIKLGGDYLWLQSELPRPKEGQTISQVTIFSFCSSFESV